MDGCGEGRGKKRCGKAVQGGEWVGFSVEGVLGIWRRASEGERGGVCGEMMLRSIQQ